VCVLCSQVVQNAAYHRNYTILKDKTVIEFTLLGKIERMEQVKKTIQEEECT